MHDVFGNVVDFHRLERADTDMQRDAHDLDSSGRDRSENLPREVQSRGRRGDRARFVGVDGLIRFAIAIGRWAADVWRQRHDSDAVDLRNVALESEDDRPFPFVEHASCEALGESQLVARPHPPRGFAPRLPRDRIALQHE